MALRPTSSTSALNAFAIVFPELDRDILKAVLDANSGCVELAIAALTNESVQDNDDDDYVRALALSLGTACDEQLARHAKTVIMRHVRVWLYRIRMRALRELEQAAASAGDDAHSLRELEAERLRIRERCKASFGQAAVTKPEAKKARRLSPFASAAKIIGGKGLLSGMRGGRARLLDFDAGFDEPTVLMHEWQPPTLLLPSGSSDSVVGSSSDSAGSSPRDVTVEHTELHVAFPSAESRYASRVARAKKANLLRCGSSASRAGSMPLLSSDAPE